MSPSTIVILNDFAYVNGGAAQVALTSAKGFAKRGFRVILFSAVGLGDAGIQEAGVTVVSTAQYETIQDPNRMRAAVQGIWNSAARRRIRGVLNSLDPEKTIVHLHSWVKALSSSVVSEVITKKFSIVCTLHDYFVACPNGGFFDYQQGRPCGEKALSTRCILRNCDPRSYSQKLWRVTRHKVQNAIGGVPRGINHFISVSKFSEQILRQYLPATSSIDLVENPIEATLMEPAAVAKNCTFLYVGRLAPEKGALTFAKAASHIGAAAIFVGDGPDAQRIKSVYPRSEVMGWLPRDLVTRQMRLARALVMPSLWYETQGLVVSEAAAHGVPAIVSDRCAAREAVIHGKTGFWYDGGDYIDLARKMEDISRSTTAEVFGKNAFDLYWANPVTLERHIDTLERLFKGYLIQRPTPKSEA